MAVALRAPSLSLAELEAFDPAAPAGRGQERRFACPMPPCAGHPRDAAHRALSLNVESGKWICHRCGGAGVLPERRVYLTPRQRAVNRARRAFSLRPAPAPARPADTSWTRHLAGAVALPATPAEAYLSRRGIPVDPARRDVLFAPGFYGGCAAVFALRNREGKTVAVHGRFLNDNRRPNKQTAGPKSLGVFATAGALAADMLAIVEAPIDALSLAAVGLPAVALVGTVAPDWLASAVAFKRILIAVDADVAGDAAALKLSVELSRFGAKPERLRPASGKDWNDALQAVGQTGLRRELGAYLPQLACDCDAPWCPTCASRKALGGR